MRVLKHHDLSPTSPSHVRPLSLTKLDHLLLHKVQRSYSIDSRESTPEVCNSQFTLSPLDHWKNLASLNERLIRGLGDEEDHCNSIPSPEYWKIRAEWLDTIYSRLTAQGRNGALKKSSEPDNRVDRSDGPVSSRLRSTHERPSRTSNTTTSQVYPITGLTAKRKTHRLRRGIRKRGSGREPSKGRRSWLTVQDHPSEA